MSTFKYVFRETPNPEALKLIINRDVKLSGKANFNSLEQAKSVPLAHKVLSLKEVKQIHFFRNILTITKILDCHWDESLQDKIVALVEEEILNHDADFQLESEEKQREVPKEWKVFDDVLNDHIRAGLQADGGDIRIIGYNPEEKILEILYEGACSNCPSATMGTLYAIEGILQENIDKQLTIKIIEE